MTALHYTDEHLTLWRGDALTVLQDLPAGSVDCCVTSPPYFGLRDYGVDGQLGAEASPAEYVENLRALFAEVHRVLADDGTLWLNLGDSYAANSDGYQRGARRGSQQPTVRPRSTLAPKNLMGIPWRVAFALQDDGWILRNSIIWHKPNAMPESVTDRLSTRHENVFMLTKSKRYWFDLDPIREPVVTPLGTAATSFARDTKEADVPGQAYRQHRRNRPDPATRGKASGFGVMPNGAQHTSQHERGRNPGDVWSIPTTPFPGAHFAVMPPALADRCILAGCKPGGTVLDPFSGSGTTGMVAAKHGRRYVGIDLNAEYLDLSMRTRLAQPGLDFGEAVS